MISILIPVYNGVEFAHECINSVINQTFQEFEVIIGINGHPIHSSVEKTLCQYASDKIKIIHYTTNGKANTLNAMLYDCKFDWICLLDIDDKWFPQKLEKQIPFTKKYDIIGTNCKLFGDCNNVTNIPTGDISDFDFLKVNPIINSSCMVKKKLCYWEDFIYGLNDYDMWVRLRKLNFKFYNCDEVLVYHRIHKDSAFNSKGNRFNVPKLINHYSNLVLNTACTIVTGYFNIKSKFAHEQYVSWMKNMLCNVRTPMVIYTDKSTYNLIYELRKPFMKFTKIIVCQLSDFYMYKYVKQFENTWLLDHEKHIHTPELYMVWAEKSFFLRRAIENNYFNTYNFFWCDIGSLRGQLDPKNMIHWPYISNCRYDSEKVYISKVGDFDKKFYDLDSDGIIKHDTSIYLDTVGGLFGGGANVLQKWADEYEYTLQHYFKRNKFAGKDQLVYLNICLKNPDMVNMLISNSNNKYYAIYNAFFNRN